MLTRRGSSLGTYLDRHNGHFVLVPVVIYKLLFALVGLRHTPVRIIVVLLHLACCGLLYVLVRPRVGPWLALVPAALLLFMGSAWHISCGRFRWAIWRPSPGACSAGGIGAVLPPPRHRGGCLADHRGRKLGVGSRLSPPASSYCSSSAPVATILGHRRPLLVFAVWYVGWSTGESTSSDALLSAPQYIASAAAGATAGIAGLDLSWGLPLLVGLAIGLVTGWRLREDRRMTPIVLAALAARSHSGDLPPSLAPTPSSPPPAATCMSAPSSSSC